MLEKSPRHLLNALAFLGIHLWALDVFRVGARLEWVALAFATYVIRIFAITAGYHRYFSHRAFRLSRPFQFALGLVGCTAFQRGPLWWASHHRRHHRESDGPGDVHSPRHLGFWWAHMGWLLSPRFDDTDYAELRDFASVPEIMWLNRLSPLVSTGFAAGIWVFLGYGAFVWAFVLSTVLVWHATFLINSVSHWSGARRYDTPDESRNNRWVALVTGGEGWHNNHHRHMTSARLGFFPGETDWAFWILRAGAAIGVVHELREPPEAVLAEGRASES